MLHLFLRKIKYLHYFATNFLSVRGQRCPWILWDMSGCKSFFFHAHSPSFSTLVLQLSLTASDLSYLGLCKKVSSCFNRNKEHTNEHSIFEINFKGFHNHLLKKKVYHGPRSYSDEKTCSFHFWDNTGPNSIINYVCLLTSDNCLCKYQTCDLTIAEVEWKINELGKHYQSLTFFIFFFKEKLITQELLPAITWPTENIFTCNKSSVDLKIRLRCIGELKCSDIFTRSVSRE